MDEPASPALASTLPTQAPSARIHFLDRRFSLWGALSVIPVLACVASILGYAGSLWPFLDVFSAFRVQYAWFFTAIAIGFAFARRHRMALFCVICALANALPLIPLFTTPHATSPEPTTRLRILSANVLTSNIEHARLLNLIAKEQPDIILLYEVGADWDRQLDRIKAEYPHHLIQPERDNFGIALLSKRAPDALTLERWGTPHLASVRARFTIAGRPVTIIGTHPIPPISTEYAVWRNSQLREIAKELASTKGARLLMGDFNMTADSHIFSEVCRTAGLTDSRRGFGIQGSWPVGLAPLFRIAIDHVLVSEEVQVLDRRLGPSIGSDHLPVIVDVAFDHAGLVD